MSHAAAFVSALGLLAAGAIAEKQAVAAPPVAGYTGQMQSSLAGCPYLAWRLVRHDNGEVSGIFYYSDMSGVSTANGTISAEGQFLLTLTPSIGKGPVATVTGTRSTDGTIIAIMNGLDCANMRLQFDPTTDLNLPNLGGELRKQ
jgi:hypothetical protein